MSEDNHLARAIAYAMTIGLVAFVPLHFALTASGGLLVLSILIAIAGTLLLISNYRRADERSIGGSAAQQRRHRTHAAVAFSLSLAIIGAGTAALPPGALAHALDRSATAPETATGSVGLLSDAGGQLSDLAAKAESIAPGSTDHVVSISVDNHSVLLLAYDPGKSQSIAVGYGTKLDKPQVRDLDLDNVGPTFAIKQLSVSDLNALSSAAAKKVNRAPSTQDSVNISSVVPSSAPVITLRFGSIPTDKTIEADSAGNLASSFAPDSPVMVLAEVQKMLDLVGVSADSSVISSVVMQGANSNPLSATPLGGTSGVLITLDKVGSTGTSASIYRRPDGEPVITYGAAAGGSNPAYLFSLKSLSASVWQEVITANAVKLGASDAQISQVALQYGVTSVVGKTELAITMQFGSLTGSYAVYSPSGSALKTG